MISSRLLSAKIWIENKLKRSFFNPYKEGKEYSNSEQKTVIKILYCHDDGTVEYTFTELRYGKVKNSANYSCKWYGLLSNGYTEEH